MTEATAYRSLNVTTSPATAARRLKDGLNKLVLNPGFLPKTNLQGVHIRSEKYPLKEGDTFTLYSTQVDGTYRGYRHFANPGEYFIAEVGGINGGELVIRKTNGRGDPFRCSAHSVYAILSDQWSKYHASDGAVIATIEVGADTDGYRYVANGLTSKVYATKAECIKTLRFVFGENVLLKDAIGDF